MEALSYSFNGADGKVPASTVIPVPEDFDEAAAVRALLASDTDARPALLKFVLDCLHKVTSQIGWQQKQRDAMTSLIEQIEEMRSRMNALAAGEQGLVTALGEALARADQKLLQDVRSVAADHEARRGAILSELQSLAARMGALPRPPQEPYAALMETPVNVPPREIAPLARGGGDWRQAAAQIEEVVSHHLKDRAAAN
jgi:hypothetical protein